MTLKESIASILRPFQGTSNGLSASQWAEVQSQLDQVVDATIREQELAQQLFDLSYSEFQQMWTLVAQRESLIKAVFDASSDVIFMLDQQGQITEFNQTFLAVLGVDGTRVLGQPIYSFLQQGSFAEEMRNCFFPLSEFALQAFCGKVHEMTVVDHRGRLRLGLVRAQVVMNGPVKNYAFYVRDVTDERAAIENLEKSRMVLLANSKMSALGEMAGGIAREINTPIGTIQIRTEALLEILGQPNPNLEILRSGLSAIDSTIRRVGRIVTGLMSFARDSSHDSFVEYSVERIINETLGFCEERFADHDVQVEVDGGEGLTMPCRPGEISQVLLNLLNNAFDAVVTLPAGSEKWVKIEAQTSMGGVVISVTDSGPGIAPAIREQIMKPFFTTKTASKAAGLGLSIAKGIVDNHHGFFEIDVTSPHTRFLIFIPGRAAAA